MPTYEYECQQCHERVEAVQKFTDAPLSVCPLCGGELRKVFSAVGIVFKGSGFYKNDSRGASSSSANSSTPSTESGSSSDAGSSTTTAETSSPSTAAASSASTSTSAAD